MLTATERYLGPAEILDVDGGRLRVSTPEGERTARTALGYPYDPSPGDEVLVIAEEECYVIGVLTASKGASWAFPGDLDVVAGGAVRIAGARGVDIGGPSVAIRGERIELAARKLFSCCSDLYQWVKGAIHVTANRTRTVVEEHSVLRAGRIVRFSKTDVKIDGREIHLG